VSLKLNYFSLVRFAGRVDHFFLK